MAGKLGGSEIFFYHGFADLLRHVLYYIAFCYFKICSITLDIVINSCVEFGNLSSFILIKPENSLLPTFSMTH